MIKLGKIRKELEEYDYCEIIYDLSDNGCKRYNQQYQYVYQLLMRPDDYIIPYICYEVIYDWDDFGAGDGKDCICFYSSDKGYLESNPKAYSVYGKPEGE